MNQFSAQLNKINKLTQEIAHITVLKIGLAYEILELHRIKTKYGDTLVAALKIVGYSGEDPPIRVFLPKRFNELSDDAIASYNESTTKPACMIYRGLINRRHEIDFL